MFLKVLAVFTTFCISQAPTLRSSMIKASTQESGEVEKLFYGFDVTGGKSITEQDALKTWKPIIDKNSDYTDHITKYVGSTETRSSSYASSSLSDVSKQYAIGLGTGAMGKIYMVDFNVDATFDISTKLNQVYSQYFEVYSTYIKRHYYIVNLSTSEIRERLDPEFENELNAISSVSDAKAVISNYGTHLNTGYTFGGRLDISCYKTTSSQSFALEQSASLSSQVGVAVGAVNAGTSFSISENISQEYKTSQSDIKYSFTSYGGDSVSALTIDGLFVFTQSLVDAGKSGFVYTNWINSINEDKNLAIVDIPANGAQSIPLWNLLSPSADNAQKREYLQQAYMELAGDKYEEYQNKYRELTRSLSSSQQSADGASTINAVYIRTPNNYFIDVDGNDFVDREKYTELHKDEILYFDLERYTPIEKIKFDATNSRGVELIDLNNGIFKVTGNPGQTVDIKIKYGDKTVSLFDSINIKSTNFEGGIGTEKYPYLVSDASQFEYFAVDNVDKYYMLVKDIDFEGQQINSIGEFEGHLDGNYCKLSNFILKQSNSSEDWGFVEVNAGSISNLVIENSGTSTSIENYNQGGETPTDANYAKNSIAAKRAGLVAAYNTGEITNVQLVNPFIRNVNKRYVDKAYVGALVGENKGTIKNCAVKDHTILNSVVFENNSVDNQYNIITGALIGVTSSGEISGAVADSNNSGSVIAQMHDPKSDKTKSTINIVASGFIGLMTGKTTVKNSYGFNRGNKSISIKLSADCKRQSSHLVRTSSFVMSEKELDNGCSKVYISNGEDNRLTLPCYYNSEDIEVSVNTNVTQTSLEGVAKITVDSVGQYSKIGLSNLYSYDSTASCGVKAKMAYPRNTYITTQWASDNTIRTALYDGEYFSPAGININRNVAEGDSESIRVFYIENVLEEVTIGNAYSYKLFADGDKQIEVGRVSIEVEENELVSIFVDDSEEYEIYHDMINDYIDDFSYSNIRLRGVLSNGQIININADDYFNRAKLELKTTTIENGENEVFISYGNASKKFNTSYVLRVIKRNPKSISITKNPNKTSYAAFDRFDPTGMEVTVSYDLGDDKIISGSNVSRDIEFTGDVLSFGRNEVILTYEDYRVTTKYIINVENNASYSISGNYKTTFNVGDTFNYDGLYLLKTYSDGHTESITSGFTFSSPNMSTPGNKTVVVTYQGITLTYEISVLDGQEHIDKTITSISIYTVPRTSFSVGETFNYGGLVILVSYDDGTTSYVNGEQCIVSMPDMSTEGNKTITVTYRGFSTSYQITVTATSTKEIKSISIFSNPNKTVFTVGDTFSSDGLEILVTFVDDTVQVVDGSQCQLSKPNMNTVGEQTIKVIYRGFMTDYKIQINEKSTNQSSGCGGRVAVTSITLSSLALLGFVLILLKRKNEKY